MKALVVGGAGTTGVVIVEALLERGYDVTILHRGVHPAPVSNEVRRIHADPHWREDLDQALAGESFDLTIATYGRLRYVAEALVGKTSRLISIGGALPVYAGWMNITSKNPWDELKQTPFALGEFHELARAAGVDAFGDQVRDSEDSVLRLHREGVFVATHFRYPIVYGPRHIGAPEWGIQRRIRDRRKRLILPGGGLTLLSRGYCKNIVHALMLALDKPEVSGGQLYNICDQELTSTAEWVDKICEILDWEFEKVEIPFDFLPSGFRASCVALLYRYHRVTSIEKVEQELGYRDVVSFDEGMRETLSWYEQNPLPAGGEIESNIGDPYDYEYEDQLMDYYQAHQHEFARQLGKHEAKRVVWRHPYPHPKKRGDLR